ncbi:S1C family serine protease [Gemmatimonadota bacterium]
MHMRSTLARGTALSLSALTLAAIGASATGQQRAQPSAARPPLSLEALLATASRSAVRVLAYPNLRRADPSLPEPRGRPIRVTNIGMGVRFGVSNRVLTAASVIAYADSIVIQVGSRHLLAELLGMDQGSQLALLSVNGLLIQNEPPPVSPVPVRAGDAVAMVDLLGDQENMHIGSVTAVYPNGRIITDLPVYPGLSGAPLLNGWGEVVGMIAFASTERSNKTGAGDAIGIPADLVAYIAGELEQFGRVRRGHFGTGLDNAIPDQAVLADVDPEGPAGLAGLRAGDRVTHYGGSPVENSTQLVALVRATVPGTAVPVRAARDSTLLEVTVVIGDGTAVMEATEAVVGYPALESDLAALARWRALIDEFEDLLMRPEFDPGHPDIRTRLAQFEQEVRDLKQVATTKIPPF